MKKLLLVLGLLACGDYADNFDTEQEIAQEQQPWQIKTSSVATWGVRTDAVRTRCDLGTTNQTCFLTQSFGSESVGQNHQMIFPVYVDFTGRLEWKTQIESLVDGFCTNMQNTINMTPSPVNNFTCYRVNSQVGAKLIIKPSALNLAPNNTISNFGSVEFNSVFTLNETLNGVYKAALSSTVRLDPTIITNYSDSQGWSSSQKLNAFRRVLWHYMLAGIGIGSQTTAPGFASYGSVTGSSVGVLSSEERCRIRNIDWDENNLGTLNAITGC